MKIGSVTIRNFRSILDTKFNLSKGVTAFAGGNESGKSNVLFAIERFLNKKDFESADKYQLSETEPSVEIVFQNFTPEETDNLKILLKTEDIKELTIKRIGNRYELVSPPIIEQASEVNGSAEEIPIEDKAELIKNSEEQSEEVVQNPNQTYEHKKIPREEEIIQEILELIPEAELIRSVEALIDGKNILINDIYPSEKQAEEIRKDITKYEKLETIRALLNLGDVTKKIVKDSDLSKRALLLQTAASNVAKKLRNSWTQEDVKMKIEADQKHLVILFRDGKNRPEDKEDDTKWIWTLPEDRSTGFRWYVTFFVRYLTRLENSKNVVFLIDDAGAPLNKAAQQDLLKEFSKKANEKTDVQIVYATHSKYMVEWDFRDNIRMTKKENGEGTKVEEMWWEKYAPSERSAPLDEMGVTWADDFLKSHNLIVEGMIDVYVLHHLPYNLIGTVEPDPYKGFKVVPAGRASLMRSLGELCKINERKAFLLFDSDTTGARECRKARGSSEEGKLKCSQIKTIVGNNSAYKVVTIEDLLPVQKYLEALNLIAGKSFGGRWSEIRNLGSVGNGIENFVFNKMQAMGITEEEKMDFKKGLKFNVVKYAVDNTSLVDYEDPSQLRAVQSFFKNLKKGLTKMETTELSGTTN